MENKCCNTCGKKITECPLSGILSKGLSGWDRNRNFCDLYTKKQPAYQPCPFCGSMDVTSEVNDKKGKAYIFCELCGAIGPVCKGKGAVPRSVESWNKRAPGSTQLTNI